MVSNPPATDRATLDAALARVRDAAATFARLKVSERIALLQAVRPRWAAVAEQTVTAACLAKGIPAGHQAVSEEWISGPFITALHLRQWIAALVAVARSGTTRVGRIGRTADGRPTVRVFPTDPLDALVIPGVSAEAHLQAGADPEDRARAYRHPDHDGRVVGVLGGGNANSIPVLDVLTMMINERSVCVLKMHPVNAYLGPLLERAFEPFIQRGFLAVVYGGPEEGAYLATHRAVDAVHVTGSEQTYQRLVADQVAASGAGEPKDITAELGNISPVIVVPGPYSARQLTWQAQSLAGGVVNNASFNCNSNKMLITAPGESRDRVLDALHAALQKVPPRVAYYPGAEARYASLLAARGAIARIGQPTTGTLPWTLLENLDPASDDLAFRLEPFCAVLSETVIPASTPAAFLEQAVAFANDRLWGTLSATIVIHPDTVRQPQMRDALEQAIIRLRYGTVSVNIWAAYGFAIGSAWGGHPGTDQHGIQSGRGMVHNTAMLEGVEKVVIRHPLTNPVKPLFFPANRTAVSSARQATALYASANPLRIPGLLASAIRG